MNGSTQVVRANGIRIRSRSAISAVIDPFCLLWLVLFGISISGCPDLMGNERHIGAYALDILQNGNWLAQHDSWGHFISATKLTMTSPCC